MCLLCAKLLKHPIIVSKTTLYETGFAVICSYLGFMPQLCGIITSYAVSLKESSMKFLGLLILCFSLAINGYAQSSTPINTYNTSGLVRVESASLFLDEGQQKGTVKVKLRNICSEPIRNVTFWFGNIGEILSDGEGVFGSTIFLVKPILPDEVRELELNKLSLEDENFPDISSFLKRSQTEAVITRVELANGLIWELP